MPQAGTAIRAEAVQCMEILTFRIVQAYRFGHVPCRNLDDTSNTHTHTHTPHTHTPLEIQGPVYASHPGPPKTIVFARVLDPLPRWILENSSRYTTSGFRSGMPNAYERVLSHV
mmetsp:Transcript_35983/g.57980  ORF Transcript_35983/g.57980 Transcript_35983/m.57980 type:complete len:114 (-) Transcript_35983:66-407(-)